MQIKKFFQRSLKGMIFATLNSVKKVTRYKNLLSQSYKKIVIKTIDYACFSISKYCSSYYINKLL